LVQYCAKADRRPVPSGAGRRQEEASDPTQASQQRRAMLAHRNPPAAADVLIAMLWNGPDPIVVADLESGRLLRVNDPVSELTGVPPEELLGRTMIECGLWTDPTDEGTITQTLLERGDVDGLPLELRTRSGEIRVTHVWARLCTIEGRNAVVCMARDTTESSHTEELLAVEHAIARVTTSASSLGDLAAQALRTIGQRLDWELGAWWEVRGTELRCRQLWCSPLAELPALARATSGLTLAAGQELPGWIWEHGQPLIVPQPAKDARMTRIGPTEAHAARAAVAFPVLVGDKVVAVVEFFTTRFAPADDALLETADSIGRQLGQAVRRIELEDRLAKLTRNRGTGRRGAVSA
jgi:PAS domain S-box-containing protein